METMVKTEDHQNRISLTGVGLHTGKEVNDFQACPINNGFTFIRIDLRRTAHR
jgi:UDP-3-O-[3-hydroxymyristoyl] N-acetylglucosamine deacetylase/3-hydroxyacyl-[acyl-carrier-protein] dehydratase